VSRSNQASTTSSVPADAARGEEDAERGPILAQQAHRCRHDREREPEVVLVDPAAEDVHARSARMAFDADHPVGP
jgi:hypothetical protein